MTLPTNPTNQDSLQISDQAISDPARLLVLQQTALLDSPPEEAFDRLTALASKILKAPVALFSLVDKERQFFKSSTGLEEPWSCQRETPLSHSFCKHVVASGEPLMIADARNHPLVLNNLAIQELSVIAYLGIPLSVEGQTLGSFCVIDSAPRQWTEDEIEILKSLTDSAITEIELRLVARRLRENYRQLQESEALRDQLTHMIVHDLRTPLTSFLSALEGMPLLGELNTNQREFLDISVRGGKTLLGMVGDLLDINRIDSGTLPLNYRETKVPEIAEGALHQVTTLAEKYKLTLSCDLDPDLPALTADADKLVRILVNLLGNAIKFTPAGGTIRLSAQLVDDGNAIRFAITDTGQGIASRDFERVFEKFGQVGTFQSNRSTGLGLTFCKMAVEAHRGRIWVESTEGKGSTFQFDIPLNPPAEASSQPQISSVASPKS